MERDEGEEVGLWDGAGKFGKGMCEGDESEEGGYYYVKRFCADSVERIYRNLQRCHPS